MTRTATLALLAFATLGLPAAPAFAVDTSAVVGGAIGGGAGAAVGSAVGGRNGAIIGGAIGGAAGAAIATSDTKTTTTAKPVLVEKEVVVIHDEHHDNGRHLGHKKHKHGHKHD